MILLDLQQELYFVDEPSKLTKEPLLHMICEFLGLLLG